MKQKLLTIKSLLVAVLLGVGVNGAWATDVPYTVGTVGTGDEWANRKYSDAYAIAPGETYHFTFTNTSYGSNNWNNWLLDCKASADTSADDWYFTMRSDNYGWGTSYNSTMKSCNFVWDDFKTVMNGATVDMYVNYNSTDKIIRTYATITKDATEWYYNFASKTIDAEQVYLFLSEELAVLNITTAEKVAKLPDGEKNIYKRSVTNGYGYTWSVPATITDSEDYNGWTNSGGTKTLDLTDGLKLTLGNAGGRMYTSVSPTIGNIINLDATFFLNSSTGAQNEYTNYGYFRFGNIYITNQAQSGKSYYLLNGAPADGAYGTQFYSAGTTDYRKGNTYRLQLEINTTTNKVNSMKVYVNGAAEASLDISDQALASYDYTTLEIGYSKSRTSTSSNLQLKDISITETPQTITVVDYTVKFKDGLGNTLKGDVVHDNGVVGEVYTATAEDMETFYNNVDVASATKKYVYKSGQNTETVASSTASENVITLVFDVYDKTTYHVNAQAGGSDIKTDIATGSAFLDGSTTAYWSKYLKVGDQWYVADEATYGAGITTATTNVAYTATDAIDEFYEYEALSDNDAMQGGLSGTTISGGSSQRFAQYGKKWTPALAGGTYTIDFYCYGNNGKNPTLPIYYSDSDGSNEVYIGEATACQGNNWTLKTTNNIVIPAGKSLCFYNNSNYTHNYMVDYMTLKRTGEATISKTISSAGWATYCSPYALDLANATGGLEDAYIVTGGATGVLTKTSVNGGTVPANTGLLLKGSEGLNIVVTIPVVASSTTDVSANKLVGVNSETALDLDDDDDGTADKSVYVLMNDATNGLGFYQTTTTSFTVGANTAYLPSNFAGAGAPAFFSFDSETTGIGASLVNSEERTVNSVYNLAGQRVAQPTKGLYIVKGKKAIIK